MLLSMFLLPTDGAVSAFGSVTLPPVATLVLYWTMGAGVLSLLNTKVIRPNWPKVGNVVATICAVSPGDLASVIEEIAALFTPKPPAPAAKKDADDAPPVTPPTPPTK